MMKRQLQLLVITSLLFNSLPAAAQLGGLLKKAKDKTKEASDKQPDTQKTATETQPAPPATEPTVAPVKVNETKTSEAQQELLFEYPEGSQYRVASDPNSFPFQDKYVGKIVFSSTRLNKDKTTENLFKTDFNIGDAIYGRVFIKSAVKNFPVYQLYNQRIMGSPDANRQSDWYVKVVINGDEKNYKVIKGGDNNTPKFIGWTTWQIFPYALDEEAVENNESFIKAINALPNGVHKFDVSLWGGRSSDINCTAKPLATGSFTINKTGDKKLGIGVKWANAPSKMKEPALEKEMVNVMKAYALKEGWKETFVKAKITVQDWNVVKNQYTGEKLYRTIEGLVYAQWPDGHCTMQEFSFTQDWTGTAFSKNTYFSGVGHQTTIDCD